MWPNNWNARGEVLTKLKIFTAGCLSLLPVSMPLFAEENLKTDVTSELWFNFSQDEEGAIDYSMNLTLGVTPDDAVLLSIGQAKSEFRDELSGVATEIETDQYSLGFSTIRPAPWAIGVFYEYWGKRDELVVESLGLDVNYLASTWNAGLELEYREIDVFTRELMGSRHRIVVDSPGLGLYTGINHGNWSWSLHGKWYDYSKDVQSLNSLRGLFILGLKNFDHVSSLNRWTAATRLNYQFDSSVIGLSYSYAVSELDLTASKTLAIFSELEVTELVSISVELGRTDQEQGISTNYISTGLGFRF